MLGPEFEKDYMVSLSAFLAAEESAGKIIYPENSLRFEALNRTPYSKVRVVILGQDPYHGPGEAHGLSFSVRAGVRHPPSLRNILGELECDLNIPKPKEGDLSHWAAEGVLLLNTVLTVEADQANSHKGKGWELFTDRIVQSLNDGREGLVFILWGRHAQEKGHAIDRQKHLVIETVHPSPLSARKGFFGSRPFSKVNDYLTSRGEKPINW